MSLPNLTSGFRSTRLNHFNAASVFTPPRIPPTKSAKHLMTKPTDAVGRSAISPLILVLSLLMLGLTIVNGRDVFADAQSDRANQEILATLEQHCDEFALLRLHHHTKVAERLVLPTATALFADGRLQNNLIAAVERLAKQKAKKQQDPDKEWTPEPHRVLHREIQVHGDLATSIEFLGAISPIADGKKVKPLRRTITWVRQHGKDATWQVASAHESPYSNWEPSITKFEQADAEDSDGFNNSGPSVVFVGSSSIRGWHKTLQEDFAGMHVIGRGFGGSQLIDSTMYAHRIVLPYKPKAVAVYAGDNDVAYGKSAEHVARDFRQLVNTLHAADSELYVGFIAIKPSLSRWKLWPEMNKANQLIADFAAKDARVTYLDIATPMLGGNGEPKPELFVKDGLHLSRSGYELWTSVVKPWLRSL